jgi:hypothetical protein
VAKAPPKRNLSQPESGLTENALRLQAQELGWLGRALGSRQQAAVIFAGAIGVLSTIGLITIGLWAPSGADKSDLLKTLSTVIIAAFTFLGGVFGGGGSNK